MEQHGNKKTENGRCSSDLWPLIPIRGQRVFPRAPSPSLYLRRRQVAGLQVGHVGLRSSNDGLLRSSSSLRLCCCLGRSSRRQRLLCNNDSCRSRWRLQVARKLRVSHHEASTAGGSCPGNRGGNQIRKTLKGMILGCRVCGTALIICYE